jgi:hypothetical protein
VREDGQRLLAGCLPTLIEWGTVHPTASLPESGVSLQSLSVCSPHADTLNPAYAALGLPLTASQGPSNLQVVLSTPRGLVTLNSNGL